MSIRWKVALLCIVLAVLPIAFLNSYTVRVFDQFTRKMLEEQMIDYAHIIAADYRRQVESGNADPDFPARLRHFQGEFGARLQIVDANGILQYDSGADASTGTDLTDRREVQAALQGRYGARTALTDDRALLYYYIALPIHSTDGTLIGAACVQAHTAAITRAILEIVRNYRMAMALALGIAMLAAIALASTLTKRLRTLTQSVRTFARGESQLDVRTAGRDEIGELARAFATVAAEIRQAGTRQRDLLASTTHQLKTPLTAIKGAVQILKGADAAGNPAVRERFLANIDLSADRLLYMVEQLAVLSSLKAEELRGRKSRVDYGAFVRDLVERLYPAPNVPITLALPDEEITLAIIPERIEQVLANLLDNALRHTPGSGSITVSVRQTTSSVETVVQDNGAGIEPSDLPRVFEQFFTTQTQQRGHGSGLGLAIAQSIIQNHGGTIHAQSTPGAGSTFTFTLPR
jgi:signal transduction histidine kinase